MTEKFKPGDRVMRSDALAERSVPGYRDMRGTIIGFDWTRVLVQWDCDGKSNPTPHLHEDLAPAAEPQI